MDKDLVLWVVNGLLGILGFFSVFAVNRLAKSIDSLASDDRNLSTKMQEHREDVLKNYAKADELIVLRHDLENQMEGIKKDIIGRMDRLEMSFKEALMAHEHRETQMFTMRNTSGRETP